MRVIAVIQARLNSKRLPGKVTFPLIGKSMWEHVYERVSRSQLLDDVVMAWPEKYDCRENDLVTRLLLATERHGADGIVRICADNPCVEPEAIDHLVAYKKDRRPLLYMNSEDPGAGYDGFGGEFYTRRMLQLMNDIIGDLDYCREHPHKFWVRNGDFLYVGKTYPKGFRLDVNTRDEYRRMEKIFNHFGHNRFSVEDVREYLEYLE